jgi:hypothetical protein
MGWGTDFTADIYLSKETYGSIYELEDKIKEDEKYLEDINAKILMYASSNPKDLVPEDWKDEPINFIHFEVKKLLDELYETDMLLCRRYLYLEYLKEHNIEFIKDEKETTN